MTRPWEHQPWNEPYQNAVLELDSAKLCGRIEVARKAINLRIAELWCSPSDRTGDMGELEALQDALNVLRLLENESMRKNAA